MDKRKYIHFVIMFLITIIISRLAPFGQVTEQGMKVLAIFIALLYGWITIDFVWCRFW